MMSWSVSGASAIACFSVSLERLDSVVEMIDQNAAGFILHRREQLPSIIAGFGAVSVMPAVQLARRP